MEHHPKWSFVRGWNERTCKCIKCEAAKPSLSYIGQGKLYQSPVQMPWLVQQVPVVHDTTNASPYGH